MRPATRSCVLFASRLRVSDTAPAALVPYTSYSHLPSPGGMSLASIRAQSWLATFSVNSERPSAAIRRRRRSPCPDKTSAASSNCQTSIGVPRGRRSSACTMRSAGAQSPIWISARVCVASVAFAALGLQRDHRRSKGHDQLSRSHCVSCESLAGSGVRLCASCHRLVECVSPARLVQRQPMRCARTFGSSLPAAHACACVCGAGCPGSPARACTGCRSTRRR